MVLEYIRNQEKRMSIGLVKTWNIGHLGCLLKPFEGVTQ